MSVSFDVYTNPGCMPCKATIKQLTKLGATYQVLQAGDHMDVITRLGATQAPVVVAKAPNGTTEHWSGYRPDRIKAALDE